LFFKLACFTLRYCLHKIHNLVVTCEMTEKHSILGAKVHVYQRENSPVWQCSTYLARNNQRVNTKEKNLSKAKDSAEDWYLELRGKNARGEHVN